MTECVGNSLTFFASISFVRFYFLAAVNIPVCMVSNQKYIYKSVKWHRSCVNRNSKNWCLMCLYWIRVWYMINMLRVVFFACFNFFSLYFFCFEQPRACSLCAYMISISLVGAAVCKTFHFLFYLLFCSLVFSITQISTLPRQYTAYKHAFRDSFLIFVVLLNFFQIFPQKRQRDSRSMYLYECALMCDRKFSVFFCAFIFMLIRFSFFFVVENVVFCVRNAGWCCCLSSDTWNLIKYTNSLQLDACLLCECVFRHNFFFTLSFAFTI